MGDTLESEILSLGPWHMDLEVAPGVRTGASSTKAASSEAPIWLVDPDEMRPLLSTLYPRGLTGKRVLDVACNAGGYSLLTAELGADHTFGFDVREHWIRQAEFLKRQRPQLAERVEFAVCDLLEIEERLAATPYELCLFKGIFYHLPDPIAALKKVADQTSEVIVLDTAAAKDTPDGCLRLHFESTERPMSGVHKLAWFPSGPRVLRDILRWLGFTETRLIFHVVDLPAPRNDRILMVGARSKGLLADFDASWQGDATPADRVGEGKNKAPTSAVQDERPSRGGVRRRLGKTLIRWGESLVGTTKPPQAGPPDRSHG